jgi:TATA-box binding protein (TBP) (component of TFIID and TFIIIB)
MLFDSSRLVVIGANSVNLSLFAAQQFRRFIENTCANFIDPATNKTVYTNIVNRCIFDSFEIHNIVARTIVGRRLRLKTIRDSRQQDANFTPELFPGVKLLIWIKPPGECRCVKKKKASNSCECNVQTSLFDSGRIILTGSKKIRDLNRAKHILIHMLEEFYDNDAELPHNQRFEARRKEIFKASVEMTGFMPAKKRRVVKVKSPKAELIEILNLLPKTKVGREISQALRHSF